MAANFASEGLWDVAVTPDQRLGTSYYLKLIKSVRLSVDALAFNGSLVAFALF